MGAHAESRPDGDRKRARRRAQRQGDFLNLAAGVHRHVGSEDDRTAAPDKGAVQGERSDGFQLIETDNEALVRTQSDRRSVGDLLDAVHDHAGARTHEV